MLNSSKHSRRRFLGGLAAAASAPYFVPSTVLGKDGGVAPSNRIVMGCVGLGWQGTGNMKNFMKEDDCQVIAVCDIDRNHLEKARNEVNSHYGNQDCRTYQDFRELFLRKDIDAVSLGLPDHWHAIPAIMAANAGKDIFSEKPISKTLHEGRAMVDAVKRNQRIWQTGSWQRSIFNFRQAVELVRNGYIGKVNEVIVGLPAGHNDFAKTGDKKEPTKPPAELDYEYWIGPAKMVPYIEARSHKNWRWNYNTGGGQLMDWIGHHCDIAHWGLGNDDAIGPIEVEGSGVFPERDAVWNTATSYRIHCVYPDGVRMTIASRDQDGIDGGTKWIGDNGWVYVDRGKFDTSDKAWMKEIAEREKKGDLKVLLHAPKNHFANFLECVKTRKPTLAPAEVAHRSATPGHLGQLAMETGKKLVWDAKTEKITNHPELNNQLGRDYRAPWTLSV